MANKNGFSPVVFWASWLLLLVLVHFANGLHYVIQQEKALAAWYRRVPFLRLKMVKANGCLILITVGCLKAISWEGGCFLG